MMSSTALQRACRAANGLEWSAFAVAIALGALLAWLPLAWSAMLVLSGVVLVLTLLHPHVGLLLAILSVPFSSLGELHVGVITIGVTEALVMLTLASWLMRLSVRRELRLRAGPVGLPLLLFLGAGLLSLPHAPSLQHAGKELLKWMEVLGVYLFVVTGLERRHQRLVLYAMLGAGAMAALQGIYQFLFGIGPDHFLLFGRFMRAHGNFEQPNPYGGYLGLVWPLALGIALSGCWDRARRATPGWSWWGRLLPCLVAGGAGAVVLSALVMTWSRGAWLGALAALAVMGLAVLVRFGGGRAVLGFLLLALAGYGLLSTGLSLAPSSVISRLTDFLPYLEAGTLDVRGVEVNDANYAVIERLAHWQAGVAMWTDHPWLGVGIGNYEPAYPAYQLPGWDEPLGHAHNYYLNIAAEAGVLGLAAYLVLWGTVAWQAWRLAVQGQGLAWAIALGALGVVTHLSVHHLFDNLFVHNVYVHLAVVLGLLARMGQPTREHSRATDIHLD